jgi:uncharacterized RDD family membrane protein YckC
MYFEDGKWSEAADLGITGLFIDWTAFMHKGKPHLFVRHFFSEDLHTIEHNAISNSTTIGGSFFGKELIGKALILIVGANLIFFLLIFLLSLVVGQYKLRTWTIASEQREFASLFRRFTAKFIDTVVVILPPALVLPYLFTRTGFWSNPVTIIITILVAAGYFLAGGFLYHSLLEGIYGKTLGKKICGIIVLKDDFTKCGILAGFLRNLMRMVDSFFYNLVGVISIAGTMKWQRLGDIVAGTVVVRAEKD